MDTDIIKLFFDRDERALSLVSEMYGAYLFSVANGILQNSEDAEECVNDAYLSAWSSIPPKRPEKLAAYLGCLTRNHSLNLLKKRGAEKRGSGQVETALSELEECISVSTVEEEVEEKLLAESISRFLNGLPEEKRNIFIKRYWYLHPICEIAEHYAISESKTASVLFRLRRQLKVHLEKEGIYL